MVAQARDLIAQGGGSDAILVAGPISPAFPGIATGPAGHDQNAQFVGFFEQFIAIESAFEANGVQVHVADISEIGIEFCRKPTKEQIGSPSGAANQDFPAINFEQTMPLVSELRTDFADAEGHVGRIGNLLADFEAQFRGVEIRRAHLIWPPDSGMSKLELWELIRREFDDLGFAAG